MLAGLGPSKALSENQGTFLPGLLGLARNCLLWPVEAPPDLSFHPHEAFPCVRVLCPDLSFIGTSVILGWSHPHDPLLIPSTKTLFPHGVSF